MRTEKVYAQTIDEAAEKIIKLLNRETNASRSSSSRNNVFYFDGWDGLGASAVLRDIAHRLTPTSPDGKTALAKLEFDQLIHIDCSMWESRRALHKVVAGQLELPDHVMELFDRQDEEDDFKGVRQGSRDWVEEVIKVMYQHIQKLNRRFLLIFHNGSNEEIDLARCCGFPLSGYSTNMILWTFQGRFRLKPRSKVDKAVMSTGTTDVLISAVPQYNEPQVLWSYLVQQEASEVAAVYKINASTRSTTIDHTAQVADCFLYMLEMCFSGRHSNDYDVATHAASYWACDGIVQLQNQHGKRPDGNDDDDSLWRAAYALQREIQLDVDYHQYLPSHLSRCAERKPYWTSPTYGVILIPTGAIPNGDMFQHFDKLNVLKLSRCTFDFQSPPFICCHSLRFLWLDHCQGTGTSMDGAEKEEDVRRCFQRLWVLHVCYTECSQILSAQMLDLMTQLRELTVIRANDWDICQLQGRLPNIQKLRVKNSRLLCSSEKDLFSEMNKMVFLDFSGSSVESPMVSFNNSCLETAIIDHGCWLSQICFRGSTKLKNLVLGGWMGVVFSLDISGTAVKTLDLSTTREIFNRLDELYLLGCEKLCAILWPPKENMKQQGLSKLCIDTTQPAHTAQPSEEKAEPGTTSTRGTSVAGTTVPRGSQLMDEYPWYISVRDARLLASLEAVWSDSREMYVEVSSVARSPTSTLGASEGNNGDASGFIRSMWPCPDVPDLPKERGYIHIHDQMRTEFVGRRDGEINAIILPGFVQKSSRILHVHDALYITVTPSCMDSDYDWQYLEWCRVEKCPRVDHVFRPRRASKFHRLRTFWASDLPKARYIFAFESDSRLPNLTYLHIDSCPMLICVLYTTTSLVTSYNVDYNVLSQLKTLEITWCGDLEDVFRLEFGGFDESIVITLHFTSLQHLHLHELPRLRSICGSGINMSAPNLTTVKIRGCWSLKRLPDVGNGSKLVECDCEKEWWDRLVWDNDSQAGRYKPIHSQYYKETKLRGSVLR